MKINNKKKVSNYMTFQLVISTSLFLIIISLGYFGYHLFSGIFFLTALLVLIYGALKNRFIFEYENSGQVVSIKNYQWLSGGKKMPVFEMPQTKIIRIEIKERIFRKYLIILFSNSSGKVLKKSIDITFCNQNQTNQVLGDITKSLTAKTQEPTSKI